jgi:MFS family permease
MAKPRDPILARTARAGSGRSLAVLSLAALTYSLGQTSMLPAITELQLVFGAGASQVAWVLTGFLISSAVCTPVSGRLGDILGKRRVLTAVLACYAVGSATALVAGSLEVMIVGRVLQGVGGGIFPLCFGIVRDEFPTERLPRAVGLLAALGASGAALGLIVGGVAVEHASYRAIFAVSGGLAVASLMLTRLLIPESPMRVAQRVDLRGAAVLAVGLTLPLVAISEAHEWPVLPTTGLLLAGASVLAGWVWLQLRTDQPLADVRALAEPASVVISVATILVGFSMFASLFIIPQLAQMPEGAGGFGLGATGAGLLLVPCALMMIAGGPIAGRLALRVGPVFPLTVGAFVLACGMALCAASHASPAAVLAGTLVSGLGVGMAFASLPNLIFARVPPEQSGEWVGFNALARALGSALGSQVVGAILAASALAGSVLPTEAGITRSLVAGAGVAALAGGLTCVLPKAPAAVFV